MKNSRWTAGAAALCVLALSAYGCSSDPATEEVEEGTGSSSGKPNTDAGKTSSSGGSSGRSSSSGGNNTSGGSSSSGDVDTDAGNDDAGSNDGGVVTDGGNGSCIEIEAEFWRPVDRCGADEDEPCPNWFEARFEPEVGDAIYNYLEFFFVRAQTTIGTPYALTLANSTQRVDGYADGDTSERSFVAESGSATLDSYATSPVFTVGATLTNLKLVEATYNEDTEVWTPIQGGTCLTVARSELIYVEN